MQQKEKRTERYRQLQEYGEWLLSELEKAGVKLSVVAGNGLHIQGEITAAQKEYIRIWKQQMIETLSPKCKHCNLAMNLIEDGKLWFCAMGCESRKAI